MNQTIIFNLKKAEPKLTRTVNEHQREERASNETVMSNFLPKTKPWICFVRKNTHPAAMATYSTSLEYFEISNLGLGNVDLGSLGSLGSLGM